MIEYKPPERMRQAGQVLLGLPGVVDVDVLTTDVRTGTPTLEICVGPDFDRVPPRVLRTLAEFDLGIDDVTTRGDPTHHVVLAR